MPENIWTVVGHGDAVACLAALIEERRRLGPVCLPESLDQVPAGAGYVLQVGGAAPPGVFYTAAGRRRVPVGWLPADRHDCLRSYATTAADVVRREALGLRPGPVVLLGQWHDRTLELVDAVEGLTSLPRFRWTAERLVRRDLLEALRCGPGIALYFGHALRQGWVGYGGVSAESLIAWRGEPLGAVLSIACETARTEEGRPSFCEELVLGGFCAAALGATVRTLHEHNRILALALSSSLGGVRNLGDALAKAEIPDEFLRDYRIFGDPAAPLIGAAHAEEAARQVFAPAPDELFQRS